MQQETIMTFYSGTGNMTDNQGSKSSTSGARALNNDGCNPKLTTYCIVLLTP